MAALATLVGTKSSTTLKDVMYKKDTTEFEIKATNSLNIDTYLYQENALPITSSPIDQNGGRKIYIRHTNFLRQNEICLKPPQICYQKLGWNTLKPKHLGDIKYQDVPIVIIDDSTQYFENTGGQDCEINYCHI